MGMSHRGRLNVLANIVGKSYREIFEEFEGNLDPESVQGSGDVKYHKGARGTFQGQRGRGAPDHAGLEPVASRSGGPGGRGHDPGQAGPPVTPDRRHTAGPSAEGMFGFPCMSVLVHGDAAFAGQGVVAETLNLSGLSGYRTGGTVHVVINNQLGFTTAPASARTSVYPTDVAKMVQAPIFHVNGDDPEACVRAARLAFSFRQTFHKDVVIDFVCYRKYGHNEGDDPSYTQPLMYQRIDAKRSVRKLYTETLVRRGDITLDDGRIGPRRLQHGCRPCSTRCGASPRWRPTRLPDARRGRSPRCHRSRPGWPGTVLRALGGVGPDRARRVHHPPQARAPVRPARRHGGRRARSTGPWPKRWPSVRCSTPGMNVRLTGQDTRRGTFSHRHAVLVDYATAEEFIPLAHIGDGPGGRVDTAVLARRRARLGRLHRARLAPLGVRRRRVRVRLLGRGSRGAGGLGGAVR